MAKTPKTTKPSIADRQALRARRAEKMVKASTVTFTMDPAVRRFMDAQAKEAEMNLTHYLQKLVETHVVETAPEGDPLAARLAAKRFVIDHAVATALKLESAGKFDEHFILTVVREAETDPTFAAQYALAVGGQDGETKRSTERARVSLNQQIGRVIKKAVGARSKRNDAGKIARAQVPDAMIATYTLLAKAA